MRIRNRSEECTSDTNQIFGYVRRNRRLQIGAFALRRFFCTRRLLRNRSVCKESLLSFTEANPKTIVKRFGGRQGDRVYAGNGLSCTLTSSAGGFAGNTGLYFMDMNTEPKITELARCITARQDSGISNHRGEHSGVLELTDGPRAFLTPDREKIRQRGRRMKEPDEPMFTLTAQDSHGIYYHGRIRKLTPLECWRLQGFTDEQFFRAKNGAKLSDARLYKMAGNAVSVPVIREVGGIIKRVSENQEKECEGYAESCDK